MDYSETYIKFRDEYCPGLDIDDPRVFLRLEEEINRLEKKLGKEFIMDYSETYKNFRDKYCPGMDIDDPRVFLRLEEEITRLKKKLGENKEEV